MHGGAVRCGVASKSTLQEERNEGAEDQRGGWSGVEWSGVQVQVAGGRRERQMSLRLRKRFPLSFYHF